MTIIHWLGQACFLLTTLTGSHILIDPPNPQVGYHIAAHSIPADLVLISHHHPDHDFAQAAQGKPQIVEPMPLEASPIFPADDQNDERLPDSFSPRGSRGYRYSRIAAYHDNVHGAKRGPDTITVLHTGGLSLCHLGDLGQLALTPQQVRQIGHVDVLMIPVGGFFTVDGPQAAAIVGQLHPRVILPMHYATPALNPDLRSKLAPPTAFLAAMRGKAKIVSVKARDLSLSSKTLPKTPTIYLLRYD